MVTKKRKQHRPTKAALAAEYAAAGVPVVPVHGKRSGICTCGKHSCRRLGRHPRTENGVADATTDPHKIEKFWKKWPNARIGMVMGPPADVVALKTRGKKGRRALKELIWNNEELPLTVTVRAKDRQFRLFRQTGDHPRHADLADGVQMLGDGAFIAAPQSASRSASCRFCAGLAVGEVEIASAPAWLMALGKGTPGAAKAPGSQSAISHHPIPDGEVAMTATKGPSARPNASATGDPSQRIARGAPHSAAYTGDAVAATTEASIASEKPMTKAELFSIAKIAIERGEDSWQEGKKYWREAAEAFARTERDFGATQRQMAKAVGRSASWVNRLLKWRRSGYKELSPFGPTTKEDRVAHAQQSATHAKSRKVKRSSPVKASVGKAASAKPGTKEPISETDQAVELDRLKSELGSLQEKYKKVETELAATKTRLDQARQDLEVARRSPTTAMPVDEDLPAGLDRRPLSEDKQRAYTAITDGWANSPAFWEAWLSAPTDVRYRFFRDVLLGEVAS